MLTVTLYTKDGCGLCDEVKAELAEFVVEFPHKLQEVDITTDSSLFARYRFTIPVVKIGDNTLKAPITRTQLQTALQSATSK